MEKYKEIGQEPQVNNIILEENENDDIDILANKENLKYYNEYGAFSEDGKEYLIKKMCIRDSNKGFSSSAFE